MKRCGLQSYDDYTEFHPSAVEEFRKEVGNLFTEVHKDSAPGDPDHVPEHSRSSHSSHGLVSQFQNFVARSMPQLRRPTLPQHQPTRLQRRIGQCQVESSNSHFGHNFLLLCLPFMRHAFKVQHADICRLHSDQEFFQLLRHCYTESRGRLRSVLSLRKLTALHFAQVSICSLSNNHLPHTRSALICITNINPSV